ncbi:hypothetical protein [Streptomyces sp. NBC_00102]|uniref:hypothetical protein n=1 Tax=Streptomyces sp. NBC_00102 TaxID=2975652 RepID=UPI0022569856|nr:hypothetical protein [Streptomyces sp. NBC_00102]MCX5400719.1 hypothetical protein [Streptomyces sp. NBC_00102]
MCFTSRGTRHTQLLNYYLLTLLTDSDLDAAAGRYIASDATQDSWNTLRLRMPPALRDFMAEQARACLSTQGITDEPVQREPPATWVTDVTWPEPDPDHVDADLFRRLGARETPIRDATARLRLSYEHLRLYVEITGVAFTGPAPARGPGQPTPLQGVLDTELRRLYIEERRTITEIASLARCSWRAARRALAHADIPVRHIGASAHPFLTRPWFDHQYTGLGRTLVDIAEEAGVSQATLIRRAAHWGIPRRPPGTPGRPRRLAGDHEPEEARPTLTTLR